MNDKQSLSISDFLKKNLFAIISFLVVAGNVWIAYQLSPVVARIGQIEARAAALETRANIGEQYIPRFLSMEATMNGMDKRLERIENLLDRVYPSTFSSK